MRRDGWKYVCNVEGTTREGQYRFCHNLLGTCPAFIRTAGTGGRNFQCLRELYTKWATKGTCGNLASPPETVLEGLHSWNDDGSKVMGWKG